jgi:hypothetical protein
MSSSSETEKEQAATAVHDNNLNTSIASENSDWKHSCHENDTKSKYGTTRNAIGYGANPVSPHWPRSAKVALNFVINYEEGGEMCTLHGDEASECLLSDNGPSTKPYSKL